MNSEPTFGFVGWNPFQLLHFKKLMTHLRSSVFVLEHRLGHLTEFDLQTLTDPAVPILIWDEAAMDKLDGLFDVLVFQTPVAKISKLRKSKIAMLQYGYAKEPHNYGAWRAFADLNLTYGSYASSRIEYCSPVESVGNPRYDDWLSGSMKRGAAQRYSHLIDDRRPTILYAPTWGDLSSVDLFLESILDLASDFNIFVKLHHNTIIFRKYKLNDAAPAGVNFFSISDDLLELMSVSDLVISDYSGAIFDAIFMGLPVVLLNSEKAIDSKKLDHFSIEYNRREELGYTVDLPESLKNKVYEALENGPKERSLALRSELFDISPGATERAANALYSLARNGSCRTQPQDYIRQSMRELFDKNLRVKYLMDKLQGQIK